MPHIVFHRHRTPAVQLSLHEILMPRFLPLLWLSTGRLWATSFSTVTSWGAIGHRRRSPMARDRAEPRRLTTPSPGPDPVGTTPGSDRRAAGDDEPPRLRPIS